MSLLNSRLGRWQRGQHPRNLVHLVTVHESEPAPGESLYAVQCGPTLCGRINVRPGQGGWGHGPKKCPTCWELGHPAERMRY